MMIDKRILGKQKLREKICPMRGCNSFGVGVIGNKNGKVIAAVKVNHETGEKTTIFRNEKEIAKLESITGKPLEL
jgi:hypothetical protein